LTIRPDDERYKKNALRLSRILGIKSMAEYEERLERFMAYFESGLSKS